jgi:phosphoribosylglycinamide formyltransferase-1
MSKPLNIAVFISGTGSNLAAIIKQQQQYNYKVCLVLSNNKLAKGLDYARQHEIPIYTFAWDKSDKQLLPLQNQINKYDCQLLVLAGFMKILPAAFIQAFDRQIINIHPSLLPKYPGLHTHQRVIDNQDSKHGATVHYVNEQLDGGKRVTQTIMDVAENSSVDVLAKQLLFREHSLLPYTIGLIAQNRVEWQDDQLYFDHEILTNPMVIYD